MKSTLSTVMTFMGSVTIGCGAAIAIASAAAVTREAPTLRTPPVQAVPVEVIRLEPVIVTISRDRFEAVRQQEATETKLVAAKAKTHA